MGHEAPADRPRSWLAVVLLIAALVAGAFATTAILTRPADGLPAASDSTEFALIAVGVLFDLFAVATVGLSLLPKLVPSAGWATAAEPMPRLVRMTTVLTAVGWLVSAVALLTLRAAELTPLSPPTIDLILAYVGQLAAGQALVASAGCALLAALLGLAAMRFGEKVPVEVRLGVALFGLLPLPVTGHAATMRWQEISMVAMELHVVGAACWTGGLLATVVFLAGRPALLAEALPRFSALATLCLFGVLVTGLFTALTELLQAPGAELPSVLVAGPYGWLVLAKTGLAILLTVSGAHLRFRLVGPIAAGRRTALTTWVALELALMGLTYGVAVALSRAPVLS